MHLDVDGEPDDTSSADSASTAGKAGSIATLEFDDHTATTGHVCETLGGRNRVSELINPLQL